jgi:hypothetical protein
LRSPGCEADDLIPDINRPDTATQFVDTAAEIITLTFGEPGWPNLCKCAFANPDLAGIDSCNDNSDDNFVWTRARPLGFDDLEHFCAAVSSELDGSWQYVLQARSSCRRVRNNNSDPVVTSGLLTDLGWPKDWQIDLGDISQARATEYFIFLSFGIATALDTINVNIAVIR